MSLFILNGVGVRNDGGVSAVQSGTVDGRVRGQAYVLGKPLVATASGTSTDAFLGGFRYRSDGALRVFEATAGVPAGSSFNAGVAITPDGAACYISTASATPTGAFLVGMKYDVQGRFFMSGA